MLGALLGGKKRGLAGRLARGLGGAGRHRARSSQASERIRFAENRLEEASAKIYDLEEQLEDDLRAIGDRWMEIANEIESLEVSLEKVDISVDEVVLAWLPVD
ncbi:MAG: chromosome segregation ATPase [Candidatus Poriferisodalaceae bacterium]